MIAGWLALSHGLPRPRTLACAAGVMGAVAGIGWIGADKGVAGPGTYPGAAVGLAAAVGAFVLLHRSQRLRRRLPAAVAVGVLLATQAGQSALSNAWTDRKRVAAFDTYPVWGPRQSAQRATVATADGWPAYRTDPGREQTVGNDPLAVGGQGAQYYSSFTPAVWTDTLAALGGGWTSDGRSPQSLDNPVTDVLFSVGARLHDPPDPRLPSPDRDGAMAPAGPPTVTRRQVPPLVTVHAPAKAARYGPSPYANQEMLLGSRVYTPGRMRVWDPRGRPLAAGRRGFPVTGTKGDRPGSTYRLESSCPAGDRIYLWAPYAMADVHLTGQGPVRYTGRWHSHRAVMQPLGTAPRGGRFTVWVRVHEPGSLDPGGIGCLDPGRLAAAERRIAARAATLVHVTDDGISAQLPPGSTGFAVVAAPAIEGWDCSTDGSRARPARSYLGLLSVPLDGRTTRLSCSFTPPGLHEGEAIGGVSLAGLVALAVHGWWRGRRRGGGTGGGEDGPVARGLDAAGADPVGPAVAARAGAG